MTTIRIVDCDGDTRTAADETEFSSPDKALKCIQEGIKNGTDSIEYLPWKVVDYDSAEQVDEMLTYVTIHDIQLDFDLEYDSDRLTRDAKAFASVAPIKSGKVKRRIK